MGKGSIGFIIQMHLEPFRFHPSICTYNKKYQTLLFAVGGGEYFIMPSIKRLSR